MVLCHINLNLEYAQLHNKLLEITMFYLSLQIKYCANYLFMYVINTISAPYYNPNIFDPVNMLYLI